MATICHTTFSNAFFFNENIWNFSWNFTELCSQEPNQQQTSIGLDNGLALRKHQAIIWTIDGIVYQRKNVSLGLSELKENSQNS